MRPQMKRVLKSTPGEKRPHTTAKRRPATGFGGFRLGVRRPPPASFSKECNRRRFSPAGLRQILRRVSGECRARSPVLRPRLRRKSPAGLRRKSPAGLRLISPAGLRLISPAGLRRKSPAGLRLISPAGLRRISPAGLRQCHEMDFKGNPVLREGFSSQACATKRLLKAILCYEKGLKGNLVLRVLRAAI